MSLAGRWNVERGYSGTILLLEIAAELAGRLMSLRQGGASQKSTIVSTMTTVPERTGKPQPSRPVTRSHQSRRRTGKGEWFIVGVEISSLHLVTFEEGRRGDVETQEVDVKPTTLRLALRDGAKSGSW